MTAAPSRPTIPVLILGTGVTALGVVRAFGRKGIPTYLMNNEAHEAVTRFSRWFRSVVQRNRTTPETLLGFLENGSLEQAVLMPCSDPWVEAVARLPRRLSTLFPSTVTSQDTIALFLDKGLLAEVLTELDLPHPNTIPVSTQDELIGLPNSVLSKVFFKPRNSTRFFKRFGVKAIRFRDRDDAIRRFGQILKEGLPVLLQEYIPGPPTEHYFIDGFIDRADAVRALFARRRIRMYPDEFGNSTYMVSIPLSDVNQALDTLLRLLRSVSYRGIFSAEFKHDERDGQFKLLEVNVRPWWYIEFAQSCNVDICGLAYDDALGKPLENVDHYKIGQHCVYTHLDLWAYLARGRKPETLFSILSSWLKCDHVPFSWDDPAPAVAQLVAVFLNGSLFKSLSRRSQASPRRSLTAEPVDMLR
jgi:D-aspartate ligase